MVVRLSTRFERWKPGHGERRGGNEEKPWPEAAESTQAPSDEETRSNTWLEIVVTLTHST